MPYVSCRCHNGECPSCCGTGKAAFSKINEGFCGEPLYCNVCHGTKQCQKCGGTQQVWKDEPPKEPRKKKTRNNHKTTYSGYSGGGSGGSDGGGCGCGLVILAVIIFGVIGVFSSNSGNKRTQTTSPVQSVENTSNINQQEANEESVAPQAMPNAAQTAPLEDSKPVKEQESRGEIRQKELATQSQIEATTQWQPSPFCENILKECGGKPNGVECIFVRYINSQSTCQGSCAEAMNMNLRNLGFDVNIKRWWSMDSGSGFAGCVGYRPDIGGSIEGAKCLARILGPQYQVGTCTSDGFPYNVRLY